MLISSPNRSNYIVTARECSTLITSASYSSVQHRPIQSEQERRKRIIRRATASRTIAIIISFVSIIHPPSVSTLIVGPFPISHAFSSLTPVQRPRLTETHASSDRFNDYNTKISTPRVKARKRLAGSPSSKSLLQTRPRSKNQRANDLYASYQLPTDPEPSSTQSNDPIQRLTHEEEMSLLRQMRSEPSNSTLSQAARQRLLLHNLPLVQSIVTQTLKTRPHLNSGSNNFNSYRGASMAVLDDKKSAKSGNIRNSNTGSRWASSVVTSAKGTALTRDDLVHEGTIGLAEALDKYDLSYSNVVAPNGPRNETTTASFRPLRGIKGARLGTYATYWIRARVLRAIRNREHAFRFPELVLQASHRLVKAAKNLGVGWDTVVDCSLPDQDEHILNEGISPHIDDGHNWTERRKRIRQMLIEAAGITSESQFREAVRVRTVCQSGIPAPLETWMSPSQSSPNSLSALKAQNSLRQKQILQQNFEQEESTRVEPDPQHIKQTLSKFLMPRELEVLSLRYGLVSPTEDINNLKPSSTPQRAFRDYQAEAEEDLFGPNGMLSHYSAAPNDNVTPSYPLRTRTKERKAKTDSPSTLNLPKLSPPSMISMESLQQLRIQQQKASEKLLPFKEIGKQMTLSGEYCRRLCDAALKKLVQAVEEGRLEESDLSLGW